MKDVGILENEGKKVAVCASVVEVDEVSYTDKATGEKKAWLQQDHSEHWKWP